MSIGAPRPLSPPWDELELPFQLAGRQPERIILHGYKMWVVSLYAGLGAGLVLDKTGGSVDAVFLSLVLVFAVGTFLALLSIIAVYSTFVHQELMRAKAPYESEIRWINGKLGSPLDPMELQNAPSWKVVSMLDPHPHERFRWVSAHRMIGMEDALSQYVRDRVERLALITLYLVVPALVLLPFVPWAVRLNPAAAVALAYVALLSLWAVLETVDLIFMSYAFVHDPRIILSRVHDPKGDHTLIAWSAMKRIYH